MRVILLGAPGAGKGTQAQFICSALHIPAISTGDIFRNAISQSTALGKEVKALVENGQLVPNELVIQLVKERLAQPDCRQGFLLDGFPRTVVQAEALNSYISIDYVIDIHVPVEEIVQRLGGRRIHPASGRTYHIYYQPPKIPNVDDISGEPLIQRPDDQEATVRKRLTVYQEQTAPLKAYYEKLAEKHTPSAPKYVKIEGTGPVEEITKQIQRILSPLTSHGVAS